MTNYEQIALKIIKEQGQIIGPIAWKEAEKVSGLGADAANQSVTISDDAMQTIDALVSQYEKFFGQVSHEVCRDAVRDVIAHMQPNEIPASLK